MYDRNDMEELVDKLEGLWHGEQVDLLMRLFGHRVGIDWGIDDIIKTGIGYRNVLLNEAQAIRVIEHLENEHDASIGIEWDVIDWAIGACDEGDYAPIIPIKVIRTVDQGKTKEEYVAQSKIVLDPKPTGNAVIDLGVWPHYNQILYPGEIGIHEDDCRYPYVSGERCEVYSHWKWPYARDHKALPRTHENIVDWLHRAGYPVNPDDIWEEISWLREEWHKARKYYGMPKREFTV